GPYFQVPGSNAPVFTAPGGATVRALLSLPAGAASGKVVVPGAALLAYGSALGAGVAGCAGCAGAVVCGGVWVCAANAAIPRDAQRTVAISGCLMMNLPVAS